MSSKDLQNKPHGIKHTKKIWWYESPKGIDIVTNYGGANGELVTIPWKAIRNAIKRKDKNE